MATTLDMQDIRYINLFSKITHVNTRFFFKYNNVLVFCVPKSLVSKCVGEQGKNVKRLNQILHKKIKILEKPKGDEDIEQFLKSIIEPTTFKEIEVNQNEIIITAGRSNKAALLGRGKQRLAEIQRIANNYFGKELKIV